MKGRVFIEIIEFEGVEGCLEKLNELSELLFSEDSGGLEAGFTFILRYFSLQEQLHTSLFQNYFLSSSRHSPIQMYNQNIKSGF